MVRRQQAADRAVRPKLRSPGHPKLQRHVEVAFWKQIARGLLPEEAAGVVGVAQAVGARWFHNAGGMAPLDLKWKSSGRYLSFAEREEIALLRVQDKGVREIARTIGRDAGTISRELRRNAATRGRTSEYRASVAQWKADMVAKRPKPAKLVVNPRLREYVEDRLAGKITHPDGTLVAGPEAVQADSEASRQTPLPDEVQGRRRGRSVVQSVRLPEAEFADIERLAAEFGVPVSALIRGWVLAGLSEERSTSLRAGIERLAGDADRLRRLAAHSDAA